MPCSIAGFALNANISVTIPPKTQTDELFKDGPFPAFLSLIVALSQQSVDKLGTKLAHSEIRTVNVKVLEPTALPTVPP